jgi:hypothetical protein
VTCPPYLDTDVKLDKEVREWGENTTQQNRLSGIFEKQRYYLAKGRVLAKHAKRLG